MDYEAPIVVRAPCQICSRSIYSLEPGPLREQLQARLPLVLNCPMCGGARRATAGEREQLHRLLISRDLQRDEETTIRQISPELTQPIQ